jgi:asparaginyl-tRNA synthetase
MTTPSQVPFKAVVELRNAVLDGLRQFYHRTGVVEVRPPLLVDVTGACENVDTLLAVSGSEHTPDHAPSRRSGRGYLSQTGQLSLEGGLVDYDACWCQTTSFRDDAPDTRHLQEFELIEEEFGHTSAAHDLDDAPMAMFEQLLGRIEAVLKAGLERALSAGLGTVFGNPGRLESMYAAPFPRLTYDDALDVANADRASQGRPLLAWGDDLAPGDETAVINARHGGDGVARPTFVTLFPAEIKFFNMKRDPRDPKRVLSADVLLPFAGEAVGAAVRENDFDTLQERLVSSAMFQALAARGAAPHEAFRPYLDLIRERRTPMHAGYGIGLERLLQSIAGVADIRDISIAHRLGGRTNMDGGG